ncbi:MAG: elongation factor G [Defluviitaleaceae bacterium]|nr:elongation factor G [Defluviitaleaceae bacterium]
MKVYSADNIRNVVVLGHSGCGKTTLMEAALNATAVTSRMGKVDEGNTVSDYEAEEVRRRVSINASMIPIEWEGVKINFIDTPGFFDFTGEVRQALAVADLALILVSAKSGVEVGTEKAWELATEANIPKMIFLNNMDDENANFDGVVESMKEMFGKSIAPIQIPIKEGNKFTGYINAITKEGRKFVGAKYESGSVPAGMEDEIETMHLMLSEAVAETDDELMEKFFDDQPFTADEIEKGIKAGLLDGSVTPVFCGSATQNLGVWVLLEGIGTFAHSPVEFSPEKKGINPKNDEEMVRKASESEPFSAFVFKTIADPYVGRLSLIKVMSGSLKKDMQMYNPRKDSTEKCGQIFVMRGKEQLPVDELKVGDIGALAKLSNSESFDTLCTKDAPIQYPAVKLPPSLMSMSVAPKNKGDEDKISQAFSKLLDEDKTLKFKIDTETKQSVVYGIGDSHLDVLVQKLKNKYKLEIELTEPIVPFREMIKGKVKVQGKYKKQSGGSGQYGDVHIEFEPSGDSAGDYIFEEKIFGGSVPRQYFPAVEKGIQENVKAGPLAGYPVVGLKATLVDGSYHAVDSSELAFKMATSLAFKDGFMKAKPTLLEPIVKATVTVPDDYTGDVMGDMNKRRGRILGMDKVGSKQVIAAEVPLAEMFKYPTDLRSMTQGRGEFTMEFERYDEAPKDVQDKVVAYRKAELEKRNS